MREYCKLYTLEMVELTAILARSCPDPKVKLAAAAMVIDRAWGKPSQQIEVGKPGEFTELSDDELDELIAKTRHDIKAREKTKNH